MGSALEKPTEIIPQRPQTRWLARVYFSMRLIRFSTSSTSDLSPVLEIKRTIAVLYAGKED
jgi:hypothetical protein